MRQVRAGSPARPPAGMRAFTLIELLVVIAVIAILAGMLFPVFTRAVRTSQTARCLSNLKQLGWAAAMYVDDWNGILPYPGGEDLAVRARKGYPLPAWDEFVNGGLDVYLRSKSAGDTVWRCPLGKRPITTEPAGGRSNSLGRSYAFNDFLRPYNRGRNFWEYRGLRASAVEAPQRCILIFEGYQDYTSEAYCYRNGSPVIEGPEGLPVCMHSGRMNAVFCDGHVETVFPPDTWAAGRWGRYVARPNSFVFYRVRGGWTGPLPDRWAPFWPYDKYLVDPQPPPAP